MPVESPLKYSRESWDLFRRIYGNDYRFKTESRMVSVEDNTDKTNQPITKQSALDIFNTQVIERICLIPKFSKQFWRVDVGDYNNGDDSNVHRALVDNLGDSNVNSEYGVMTIRDKLTLGDFRDNDGGITVDDVANTFRGVMSDLTRLGKVRIVVKKGNINYTDNTYYAIRNDRDDHLIDYNTVRNSIVSSSSFNTMCKNWTNKIIDRANNNVFYYEYRLPDPPLPSDGGVKLFKKESYYESANLDLDGRTGKNSVSYGIIFGEGDTTAFFDIPKVTRNLKGVSLNITTGARLSNSGIFGLTVYNKQSNVILGHIPWSAGLGNRTFYFDNPITLSDRSYDDLVLMLNTKVNGDDGDAMNMVATINELIFDDNIRINPILRNPKVDIARMNSELVGPIFDTNSNSEILNITYKYTVRDWHFKPSVIRTTFDRSNGTNHIFVERIEQWRDGTRINTSLNPTYTVRVTNKNTIYAHSKFKGNPRNSKFITMKHNVSNLDIQNGDELRFVYGYYYRTGLSNDSNIQKKSVLNLNIFQSSNLSLRVDDILNKQELIS
mgnify:CR=1 FL=1